MAELDAGTLTAEKLSRQEAGRRGGQARMAKLRARLEAEGRTLGDYQREIRAHVSPEACRSNGAKGAAATLARHGYEFLHRKVVDYRLAHPTQPEQQMMAVLDGLGYTYDREYEPFADGPHQFTTLDFFLPGFGRIGKAIQVNGKVHNGDPLFNPDGQRPQREAERLAAVREAGIPVLVVDASDLRDPERVTRHVRTFLTTPQYQDSLEPTESVGAPGLPSERSETMTAKPLHHQAARGTQTTEQALVAEEWGIAIPGADEEYAQDSPARAAARSRYVPERDAADDFAALDDQELDLVPARCLAREGVHPHQHRRQAELG